MNRICFSMLLIFTAAAWPADENPALTTMKESGITGGLVLHLGCGDGSLTAALGKSGKFVVRGLDTDAEKVWAARTRIAEQGPYGRVSAGLWGGNHIPFGDNLVNFIFSEKQPHVDEKEIMRVLAPRGVAFIDGKKTVKPRPDTIDEWTHYLHGPDNNGVAEDSVVGPPARLQWIAGPIHLRSHEHLNSVSALVSARARIFYVLDEGATAAVIAEPEWRLVARDAFNGVLLWKREMGPWEGHFRLFRSGPPGIARRLVAVGDRVYATLGYQKPVCALEAATGKTVKEYAGTAGALEILCDAGRLFAVTGEMDLEPPKDPAKRHYPPAAPREKGIVALDAESGKVLWKRKDKDTSEIMPEALAVSDGLVFFQNTKHVICLEAASGEEKWRADRPIHTKRLSWSSSILVASHGVVLSADGSTGGIKGASKGGEKVEWILSDRDIRRHPVGDLFAFSAKDGEKLWTGRSLQGFCNPGDLFVINGLVWAGANVGSRQKNLNVALDLNTGEEKKKLNYAGITVAGHTRCYRDKATERFLVLGGTGVEFVDVNTNKFKNNIWVRGTCQYGVMPCNGLVYVPPDSCACRPEMRLHGFTAMAPAKSGVSYKFKDPDKRIEARDSLPGIQRLVKGPAFGKVEKGGAARDDWPTYRCDNARSGRAKTAVAAELKRKWTARIGGSLTAPVIGAGKVFVSRVDAHRVCALDADSGKRAWSRTIGGPVDSPPTVYSGLVIFGCRDGNVYCLRAKDGELVWRFRAAPEQRFLVAMEGVESVWPVHGSVLVEEGRAWFAAGRTPFLDGGVVVSVVEALTGKQVGSRTVNAREDAGAGRTPPMLPDILSASNDTIYMRWMGFDNKANISRAVKPHLFSATGFLDDTWWHRTYWQYGTSMSGGFGGWPRAARRAPAGRIMVLGDDVLFAFGRTKYDVGNGGAVHAGHVGLVKRDYQDMGLIDFSQNPYRLYCAQKAGSSPARAKGKRKSRRRRGAIEFKWQARALVLARAMVLAGDTIFIAGPPADEKHENLALLDRLEPARIRAVSTADGKELSVCEIPAGPVFDGMAAAKGRLVISLSDGSVCCMEAK